MTGATNGAGTACPSKAPRMTPGFSWGLCCSIFSFHVLSCRPLIVLLSFFFFPLHYMFFDLRVLVILLVSSNLSYVLSLMTRSFIPSFCFIILNRLFLPLQPFTSIFYYLSVCSRSEHNCSCTIKHQSLQINNVKGFIDQYISVDNISV